MASNRLPPSKIGKTETQIPKYLILEAYSNQVWGLPPSDRYTYRIYAAANMKSGGHLVVDPVRPSQLNCNKIVTELGLKEPSGSTVKYLTKDYYESSPEWHNDLSHFEVFEKIANAGYTVKTSHGFGEGLQSWTFEKL